MQSTVSARNGIVATSTAAVCAPIAWFAILFKREYPPGLWRLPVAYLECRVRVGAYLTLLRDEYPPFGDGPYPASLLIVPPNETARDRLTVAFRLLPVLPHVIIVWAFWLLLRHDQYPPFSLNEE